MTLQANAATPWLQRPPSAIATRRVFCVPHAGCGANIFDGWPERQGLVEFLPVELPGRLTRYGDPMPDTFQELAGAVIEGLRPHLDVPYALFGHCWSGLAVYEVAVQLQRAGLQMPQRLFVSGQVAPQDGPVGRMLDMDDAELAHELSLTIRAAGNHPHPELVAIYAKVLRTDVEVCRRYVVPEPTRLNCPVTAIGWADDTEVPPERMAGWAQCADTTFEVFPGRHERFLDAPPELLRTLSAGTSS
ncbi:thioesterase domain-containing protein [Streptomyces sp. NPDC093982]|uniref:thioesterase II family protein n=1 Tax=Streptomyces sp. NPDC093982 TaxID=3155077 RepID=UPI00341BBFA9